MHHSSLKRLPLATAIIGVLSAQVALAQEEAPQVTLDTIVVKLDRQGTKVKTNVVTTKQKDESTETDLRGLLTEEPAISIGGGNGTSQYYFIRGMGQNSIDVKVDNAYSDSQILYHQGRFMLDPALVKIVSVQKGAGSASAGIGATNGAIVAKTLDAADLLAGSDKDYGFKVNAGYSSNDGHSYGASVFGRTNNLDFLLSGNRVNEDDYKAGSGFKNGVDGKNKVPYSGLDKVGYLAKAGINLGNHRFVLSHLQEQHKGNRLVREEFALDNSAGSRLTTARQAPAYRKTTLSNSNLEWSATDLGLVENATANVYQMKKERYSADDSKNGYAGNIAGATTTLIETRGANLNLDWNAADVAVLKTGVNYRNQVVSPDRFLKPNLSKPEKTDVGAYAEVIGDIGNVTATAGVRYDYFEFKAMDGKTVSNAALNPSVGLIWQPLPSLSLNANHNYATRSPRLYDALLSHGNRGITSIADGTTAERARNTEVGFNYNHRFANSGRVSLNGSYFWQRIDDAVVNPQNRHGVAGVREIVNAGHITNEGYEVGASYQLKGFTAKVGVSDSNPKFEGIITSGTNDLNPEFGAKIGRTWTGSLAYRFDNPNLELGVRNRSVEKSTKALRQDIAPQNRESYSVTDVFANWKPYGNDRMNVNFAINNVADKHYIPHSQRANAGLPAAGRDYRIGVNFTY